MDVRIKPRKLGGTIVAPPSKSHAHRVLIAQKIAEIQTGTKSNEIEAFSVDIESTKRCLAELTNDQRVFDCGESGSTLRFMLPVAMAFGERAVFTGEGKLPKRPISPLKEEMEAHGCSFETGEGSRICTVTGRLTSGEYKLPGNISSQFVTGLLLALPVLDGDSRISLTTNLESSGYVDLTIDVLKSFGIEIIESFSETGYLVYDIRGNQKYVAPDDVRVECDWSQAAFWLAAGALGGDVTVKGLDLLSYQKDKDFVSILSNMGARFFVDNSIGYVRCRGKRLRACVEDVSQIPDLVPALAVVMSIADGTSEIVNGSRLRIKESDRIDSVADMLAKLGGRVITREDGLTITGKSQLKGGIVNSHNDHRIAMAAAIASCSCSAPVIIRNADAVNKSYPTFFEDFAKLGGNVEEVVI